MFNSLKRKREDFDDSDDEEPSFGRQILPIANLPADYDGVPTDGMEYLFTVRYVIVDLLECSRSLKSDLI